MDFKPIILDNLDRFRGIVREPDRIESINVLLNEIYYRGFTRLIDNFCSQKNDANKAYDTLFEIWICKMLLENPEMQDLQYEPSDENRPPDFRCRLENVKFDVQIKRLLNVHNEMAKSSLYDECLKRLERIPRPWFINYGVSKDFNRQDINPFFEHIKKELENFKIISTMERVPLSPMYSWPDDKNPLVGFTFSEKPKKENNYNSHPI